MARRKRIRKKSVKAYKALNGGAGSAGTGRVDPRAGKRIGGDAMELIQTSKLVHERYHNFKWEVEKLMALPEPLLMDKKVAAWHCAFYETYVGSIKDAPPRFSLEYLDQIGKDALVFFLPYLRRADYLHENGKFTTVSTSADAIKVMVSSHSGKSFFRGDLLNIISNTAPTFSYVKADGASLRILDPSLATYVYFQDDMSEFKITLFERFELNPRYTDIENRYYDSASGFVAEVWEGAAACTCFECGENIPAANDGKLTFFTTDRDGSTVSLEVA